MEDEGAEDEYLGAGYENGDLGRQTSTSQLSSECTAAFLCVPVLRVHLCCMCVCVGPTRGHSLCAWDLLRPTTHALDPLDPPQPSLSRGIS